MVRFVHLQETYMTDFKTLLADLRRPRLLIRAARFGVADYKRERDLRRLINASGRAKPETAIPQLITAEAQMEQTRRAGDTGYSVSRHIEVLIALIAEVRLLPRGLHG
jgi:hypothetical protein